MTYEASKIAIEKLSEYFSRNKKSFLASGVKEAHIRQSLIDPFFEALGWDVGNTQMIAPQYREVIPEDSLDVEGQQKAPDYTFRVGTLPKFFVEAKKCGVNIGSDPAPAYQLRRYGWSGKVAVSILTDFEEFAVYDCTNRPNIKEKASFGRLIYMQYSDYPTRWREIWDSFSREAVWSGAFDNYVQSKRKRGTAEVDTEFLKDIEQWRDTLARNIALRNSDLTPEQLNVSVQQIIDRIIFLRMAEDRGLEMEGQLLKLCEQPDIYSRFTNSVCRKADEKYNSGIFHFRKEPGVNEPPDALTPRLIVDDKVIKPILENLYFVNGSPYHFGVLPVEILGTVYERFLGKVIRLTAGHQAKVEYKPDVRKAGGVYYTPTYIVNHIVQNSVGRQITGLSPKALQGSKGESPYAVLDMACGSGSFLIGAYQCLLDHYLNWYLANQPQKHSKALFRDSKNAWRLTISERKRILTSHIFGVDIDPQAVEVTKLSLLLKAFEGENDSSLAIQMKLFEERALPNLSNNIKCGNSLIASDFSVLSEDLLRIRAFDWPVQFPVIMHSGGFDAIIGNPPYIRPHKMDDDVKKYFWNHLKTFIAKSDIYSCFMERAIALLKPKGYLSFIVPHTWTSLESFEAIRRKLAIGTEVLNLVQLPKKVFQDATVETCIFCVRKPLKQVSKAQKIQVSKLDANAILTRVRTFPQSDIPKAHLYNFQLYTSGSTAGFVRRLKLGTKPLAHYIEFVYGFKTADDDQFIHPTCRYKDSKPFIRSAAISRYSHGKPTEFVWYVPEKMKANRTTARPGESARFESEKILVSRMGKNLIASYDKGGLYVKDAMLLLPRTDSSLSLKYILALLNSRLLGYYYREFYITIDVLKNALLELPVYPIDFSKKDQKTNYENVLVLVDKMLSIMPELHSTKSESAKQTLQNVASDIDNKIDRLIYNIYGLSESDVAIIESEN